MQRLATVFPVLTRFTKLPLSRDPLILLMAAFNEIFLGIDIYLAHSISGTIVPNEWIPIIFGPVAGVLLLLIGLLAFRNRTLANVQASVIFMASILVGFLGAYFHIRRGILPTGPVGERVSIDMLIWAPPVLGPLTFSLVGILGLSAAWQENPSDSGRLILPGGIQLQLPFSKTRAFFFLVGLGVLASLISMVFDHARTGFANPWLWFSAGLAIFCTVVPISVGLIRRTNRTDLMIYVISMFALILMGIIGMVLHIRENLIAEGVIVTERFIRGAPFLAPMLFADMGALGLLALLDP
jgi:hypothetical protein